MDISTIKTICTHNSPATMAAYMTRAQLTQAYETLYSRPAQKSFSCLYIAYCCWIMCKMT